MNEKKPYSTPELYRIELNQEQAILSQCSLMSSNPMAGGLDVFCRMGGCKRNATAGGSDSGLRPS
ncbi:MAG TPA: hypothetical protein VNK46_05375 [Nitrospiraceae bacterium]|jgi:hypothetical protein|nr:hypothetical protein [Nitrospiraceae bacterium]